MMKFKLALIFTLACAEAACVSSGTKVTNEQMSAFKTGVTTESEVIAKLGEPNNVSTLPDGSRVDIYTHVAASANAASYIPVVGLFAGGAHSTTDSVTFTFDPQGTLKTTASNRGQSNVNTGLANQK